MKEIILTHQFVEHIPSKLDERVIYVSMNFATVVHKCCCGCGNEVVTPLSPTDWQLIYNGETISLGPSIGNWSFECRSHYWIKNNKVVWDRNWSQKEITTGREYDKKSKETYFEILDAPPSKRKGGSFWEKIKKLGR